MKKLFLFLSTFYLLPSTGVAFGYTSADVSNASFLATEGIIVKQSSVSGYRLDDTITRAEAVGIALKIKRVTLPNNYTCKNYFIDAPYNSINNWICRAVELAKDNGIVSGENMKARPADPITRSEVLAMIMHAALNNTLSIVPKGYNFSTDTVEWQQNIFYAAEDLISVAGTKYDYSTRPISVNYFPNRNATRAEVFAFARNILTNNQHEQYDGFKADFGTAFSKITLESSGVVYGFGNKVNIENSSGYKYSIHVEPVTTHFLIDPSESLEKKSWNGNPYYATMVAGMCYTGKLIFLGQENTILITGACNESIEEVEAALRKIYFQPTDILNDITSVDVLSSYYKYLLYGNNVSTAYEMRSPAGVSFETFQSWYKDVTNINFREDTLRDMDPELFSGNHIYEFLVDMTENGVKSTYKVQSEVDLKNFKINNISSVKQ